MNYYYYTLLSYYIIIIIIIIITINIIVVVIIVIIIIIIIIIMNYNYSPLIIHNNYGPLITDLITSEPVLNIRMFTFECGMSFESSLLNEWKRIYFQLFVPYFSS